jgi:predicted dehydrogenase
MGADVTRRSFLQAAVATAVAGSTTMLEAQVSPQVPQAAVDGKAVRFGIIGVGMQGSGLLRNSISLPGTQCIAAADLYDGRQTLAKEIAGPGIKTTRSYREVLDDSSIDCVIVAAPDHWHRRLVVEAVAAGKDVYCEKPMSHSVADGLEMVAAVKRSGRILQVGSQRVSSPLFIKAREIIASGALGELTQVELTIGRNSPTGAWEYPAPADLSPATLDWTTWLGTAPKHEFDPLTFVRWRCWHEYGTGLAGDLMVHLISGMQFLTGINQPPDLASCTGGIFRWKDGRNMPDVQLVQLQYGSIPVAARLTLTTNTPETTRVMGTHGLLEIVENTLTYTPQRGIDTSPSYYAGSFPRPVRDQYDQEWHGKNDAAMHALSLEATTTLYGPTGDTRPHLANFFDAVRTRKPVVEDVVFGHNAAAACHMANLAYFHKKSVTYDFAKQNLLT